MWTAIEDNPHDGKQKTFYCMSSWPSSVQTWLNSKIKTSQIKQKKRKSARSYILRQFINFFFHPAIFFKFQAMTFGVLPAKICWLLMVCCSRFCKLSQGDEGFLYSFGRTLVTQIYPLPSVLNLQRYQQYRNYSL